VRFIMSLCAATNAREPFMTGAVYGDASMISRLGIRRNEMSEQGRNSPAVDQIVNTQA
jgi:hypothetical protein